MRGSYDLKGSPCFHDTNMNDLVLGQKRTDRSGLHPIPGIFTTYPDHSNLGSVTKNANILKLAGVNLLVGHKNEV